MHELTVSVAGGTLRVRSRGPAAGTRLLMLHGGPGMSDTYLDGLIDEFADTYRVAAYAQRGVEPSTARGPFDLATQADDAVSVLDALGWQDAVLLGHSFGGHLLLHVLVRHPRSARAAVSLDGIGGVGDGGVAEFGAAFAQRLPGEALARLDRDDTTPEEQLRILWPGYFPPGEPAPATLDTPVSSEANEEGTVAMLDELPALTPRLGEIAVPTLLLSGDGSPVPESAAVATASAIGPAAQVRRVPGGHFPWLLHPGVVRAAVDEWLDLG